MTVYYNEFDKKAATWLRELIKDGLIAPGDVDERSITDVKPGDLAGYTQCHFFAGIGGWSYALRLAEWPDGVHVWTGSCPCQPFSCAGKRKGTKDERHLWPEFCRLISECRPSVVFGEQVASGDGRKWLSGVRADLEALGYGVGAADLCAAGVGAPHIRQRLYWCARWVGNTHGKQTDATESGQSVSGARRIPGRLGDSVSDPLRRGPGEGTLPPQGLEGEVGQRERGGDDARGAGADGRLADAECGRGEGGNELRGKTEQSRDHGPWSDSILIPCRDGKSRRVPAEPAFLPLVDGISPGRVGLLRGAGNAIVPPVAAAFVKAYLNLLGRR